ncbi:hypothetical protein [Salinibacterium sp. ZJ454]|uniref:hypothetical protein n=1 Tax=Salinibacterium sp. ZJ454 TaxID=2708339 RepID=UPI0014221780|nr:hypothetical protein [Salinibacterium sp. ZJ454]
MDAPAKNARMAWVAIALAVVAALAGIALILMFLLEVPTNGPYYFGTTNDILGGLSFLMLPVLVVYLTRPIANSLGTQLALWIVVAALLLAALSSFLLAAELLSYNESTAITIVGFLTQAAWLIWVCRTYREASAMPQATARLGELVGAGYGVAIGLIGIAALLPSMSVSQLVIGAPGVLLFALAWAATPVWYVLLARYLRAARISTAAR